MKGRWFCPVTFGPDDSCGYQGRPEKALRPRPSRKAVLICPSCLSQVK